MVGQDDGKRRKENPPVSNARAGEEQRGAGEVRLIAGEFILFLTPLKAPPHLPGVPDINSLLRADLRVSGSSVIF